MLNKHLNNDIIFLVKPYILWEALVYARVFILFKLSLNIGGIMLRELKIENLAIIDELNLELNNGLTVLTGETGAGKSIILDGITMIIGEKASKDLIGNASDKLNVEAVFELNSEQIKKFNELEYEFENELIISREYNYESNKVRVDGKRFNLTGLKEISSNILDIVGQHDHQYLLNSNYHLSLLDKFIEKETIEIKDKLKSTISKINKLSSEISEIEKEKIDVKEKKYLYEFTVNEIDTSKLIIGEEEELESEYKLLFNIGSITERLENIVNILDDTSISKVKREFDKLAQFSDEFSELDSRFSNVYEELNDISSEICSKLSELEQDPYRLEEINSRLNIIKKLKYKYGKDIKGLLEYSDEIKARLEKLEFSSDVLEKKEKEKVHFYEEYISLCDKLSEIRKNKSITLKENVKKELLDLNMSNVEFDIEFKKHDKLSSNGSDLVKFMISTNKGEELKDLSKIASGGEISRIMLALKIVFSKVDNISCLIFDEIDTGISGETVVKIANKLKELSKSVQVICVTHSPQIAAKADTQYLIYKEIENDSTHTKVKLLDNEARVKEIARILSGDKVTNASIEIAKEMMR